MHPTRSLRRTLVPLARRLHRRGDLGFPGLGDFDSLKVEGEALKRFDISERTFLVGRLHAGSFLAKDLRPEEQLPPIPEERELTDLYTVPNNEYFRLDGRENLKGIDERLRGTEEFHTTREYFFPWFLNAEHDILKVKWQNWYWILYGGVGT